MKCGKYLSTHIDLKGGFKYIRKTSKSQQTPRRFPYVYSKFVY